MKSISNHPRSWRSSDLALCSGLNLFYVLSLYLWPATWSRKFNRDAPLNILRRLISCSVATTVAVGVLSWRYRKVTNGSVRDALRLLLFGVARESSLTQLCLGTFRAIGITFSQMICLYSGPIATDLLYRWLRSRHWKYSMGSSVTPDFVNLAGIHPPDPTVGCHVHVPNTSSFELFTNCRDECLELEVSSSKPLHDTFVSSSSSSVEFLLNEEDDLLAHVLVLICLPLRVLRLLQSLAFDTTRWPTRSWIRYVCSPSVRNYVVAPITEELTYRGVMHSLLHLSHAEVAVCGLSPNQIIVGSSRLIESKISQTVSGLFVVAHVHHVFNLWRIHGTAQTTSSRHPYARTLNHSNARKPVSPHLAEKNDDVQLPNRDYASQQQPHGGFRGAVMEQAFMTQPTQSTSCSESNSSSSSMWGDDTELEEDDMACPRMITFSNVSSGLSAAGMSNLDSTEGNTLHAVVPQSGTVTGALPPTNITDNEGEDTYMTNRDVVSLLIGNAVTHWIFSAMASRVHRANKYHILAPIILHSLCNYFGVPEISRVLLLSRASRIAGVRSRFHVVALQVGVGITYVGGIVGFFLLTTV